VSWFRKFFAFSGSSKGSRVLLLFSGHASQTKILDLVDLARLLRFPGTALMNGRRKRPLSKHYEDEVRKWLRSHPGHVVTVFHIASLFGTANLQATTMLNAINGFPRTGVWMFVRTR
jgi:hypothetical protein